MSEPSTKEIIDQIVGLSNKLVIRHVLLPDVNKSMPPGWFINTLRDIDFKVNVMQSVIDKPEDEDVSFAFESYD